MADNLTDGLNELAQGFQKRFKVSDKLTLQDMIDLVTPPVSQPNLIPGSDNLVAILALIGLSLIILDKADHGTALL
ncbi:hypothetical protein LV515_05205 [Limosilactobacillus vaginalis]|nr:hypothetical protein LV515_05205 [Limosilactobacillus vaginalis]